MELRQLQYFAEVARRGTYLAAAAALSVAQPALWRRVKDLEHELGAPLFERTGRRVRLTRAGEVLLIDAEAVLAATAGLASRAEALRLGTAGHVAIACAAPHLRAFLAPVIAEYRSAHPAVTIEVREYGGGHAAGPGSSARDDLVSGAVDVATGVPPNLPEFETIPLYDMHLALAVPDGHPWRDAGTVDVALLRGASLVLAQPGSFSRSAVEAACARAGFEPIVGFDSPNPLSIQALGAAGLGIPVLVDDALPDPDGRPWPRLAERGTVTTTTVTLGWRKAMPRSTAVEAFIELVRRRAPASGAAMSAR